MGSVISTGTFKEETIELTKKMKNNIPGAVSRSRRFRSPGPRWVEVKFDVKLNFFSPQCHYTALIEIANRTDIDLKHSLGPDSTS